MAEWFFDHTWLIQLCGLHAVPRSIVSTTYVPKYVHAPTVWWVIKTVRIYTFVATYVRYKLFTLISIFLQGQRRRFIADREVDTELQNWKCSRTMTVLFFLQILLYVQIIITPDLARELFRFIRYAPVDGVDASWSQAFYGLVTYISSCSVLIVLGVLQVKSQMNHNGLWLTSGKTSVSFPWPV